MKKDSKYFKISDDDYFAFSQMNKGQNFGGSCLSPVLVILVIFIIVYILSKLSGY